ncbi:MAG: hypothetical protein AAB483_01520 [Patescibacteria group bacterium]
MILNIKKLTSGAHLLKAVSRRYRRFVSAFTNALLFFSLLPSYRSIARGKQWQYARYLELSNKFETQYRLAQNQNETKYIVPQWQGHLERLEKEMLPCPPFNFLTNPSIAFTMVPNVRGRWPATQLSFLEKKLPPETLRMLLGEEYMGKPRLMYRDYKTSHNAIHTLYHLEMFRQTTNVDPSSLNHIVEWGGGYGTMAHMYAKLNPRSTYVLIDTTFMACLQWLYLATVLKDSNRVHLITGPGQEIAEGCISIIPVGFLKDYTLTADLFISTWALSESSTAALDLVIEKKWFNAKHFLFASQVAEEGFPGAIKLLKNLEGAGTKIESIEYIPRNRNFYIFK